MIAHCCLYSRVRMMGNRPRQYSPSIDQLCIVLALRRCFLLAQSIQFTHFIWTENFSKPTLIIKPTLSPGRWRIVLYPGSLTRNLLDRATPNFNQIIAIIISIDLSTNMSISVSGRHHGVISSMKTTMFVEECAVRDYNNYNSGLTCQSHSKLRPNDNPNQLYRFPWGEKTEISFCLHSDVIDDVEMSVFVGKLDVQATTQDPLWDLLARAKLRPNYSAQQIYWSGWK